MATTFLIRSVVAQGPIIVNAQGRNRSFAIKTRYLRKGTDFLLCFFFLQAVVIMENTLFPYRGSGPLKALYGQDWSSMRLLIARAAYSETSLRIGKCFSRNSFSRSIFKRAITLFRYF